MRVKWFGNDVPAGRVAVAAVMLLVAVAMLSLGVFEASMAGCHSGGGFCAQEFSPRHARGLAGGAVLIVASGPVAVAAFTRRPVWLLGGAAVGAGVAAALVVPGLP